MFNKNENANHPNLFEELDEAEMGLIKGGATLSELLYSLTILGVVASFATPAVLNTQQDAQRLAERRRK